MWSRNSCTQLDSLTADMQTHTHTEACAHIRLVALLHVVRILMIVALCDLNTQLLTTLFHNVLMGYYTTGTVDPNLIL